MNTTAWRAVLAAADSRLVVVKHDAKPMQHALHLDKAGHPRTFCGVAVQDISHWALLEYGSRDGLTCPTCLAAHDKQRGSSTVRQAQHGLARKTLSGATETALASRLVCQAATDGELCPNTTTRGLAHTPSVLRSDYNGVPTERWCTWCGANLEEIPDESTTG